MLIKRKFLVGVLISAVIVSLVGFNVHYYFATLDTQAKINDVLSQTVLSWATSMDIVAVFLRNVATKNDVTEAYEVLRIAEKIGEAGKGYEPHFAAFEVAARLIAQNIFHYQVGLSLPQINPTAILMFSVMAEKILNITDIIMMESWELSHNNGVDRIGLWKENGTLDAIFNYCNDAREYSTQLADFNPKFV